MVSRNNSIIENVLVLQGGGSLGAFECGVYKALVKNNINLDIVADTSIGGINAAIISGSKNKENTGELLENFWLELSESFIDLDKLYSTVAFWPYFMHQPVESFYFPNSIPNKPKETADSYFKNTKEQEIKVKQIRSYYSSAIFGNEKMFKPRWSSEFAMTDPEYFTPQKWTYLYNHMPLVKTLEKYIDYDKLKPNGNPNARLILTAVNVLNAQSLTFDSFKQQISPKHILATSAYPLYNFPWVEVEAGVYAWDGGLLSNTPLREVLDASPINDKRICMVENYPKNIDDLPKNLPEVYHRARDIIFSDKTEHSVTMSKIITRYIEYIEDLYQIIEHNIDKVQIDEKHLKKIRRKYRKYRQEHGAEIKEIYYITRAELFPHLYENADFSPETIKESIKEGEEKTNQAIKNHKKPSNKSST
jgi:NTE family protein